MHKNHKRSVLSGFFLFFFFRIQAVPSQTRTMIPRQSQTLVMRRVPRPIWLDEGATASKSDALTMHLGHFILCSSHHSSELLANTREYITKREYEVCWISFLRSVTEFRTESIAHFIDDDILSDSQCGIRYQFEHIKNWHCSDQNYQQFG